MSEIRQGITPSQVDPSNDPKFPLGLEVDDPRRGFEGNKIKYVRANGTIGANDALHCDVSFATAAERHARVISVSAVSQVVEGANDITGVQVNLNQFFWITVKGRLQVKTSGVTAGSALGTSISGQLINIDAGAAYAQAEAQAAIGAGAGKAVRAMSATGTPVANQSFVLLS